MHIGGNLYGKLVHLLGEVEHALLHQGEISPALAEINAISQQFCLNHNVEFDFLSSNSYTVQIKLEKLQKIFTLVMKLKSEDDKRLKAYEEMSKYR